jgi:hypothetical protein
MTTAWQGWTRPGYAGFCVAGCCGAVASGWPAAPGLLAARIGVMAARPPTTNSSPPQLRIVS